jgi:RNA polymerase sigma factor (sigma-70 family)
MAPAPLGSVLRHIHKLIEGRPAAELSDGQLLERFASRREEAAFAALLERHGAMVWGVCRRLLRQISDAEDAFQATFLVLVRRAAAIRKRESVGSWLYGVAYRIARRAQADATRRQFHERQVNAVPGPDGGLDAAWRELQAVLDEELRCLPEKYQAPVVLCYLEGQTHEEAAQQLGWPVGTVRGRLARARDRLRVRLTRRGLTLSAGAFATVLAVKEAAAAVPGALAAATILAALVGAGSLRVTALAEAAFPALGLVKLKLTAALLVGTVALAVGALRLGTPAAPTASEQPQAAAQPDGEPAAKVARRLSAAGKVVDAAGKPVAGATVYLRDWAPWRTRVRSWEQRDQANDLLATTTTDGAGRFAFKDVAARPFEDVGQMRQHPWDLIAVAPGRGPAWLHLTARAQEQPLTLQLPPEGKISGRITGADGIPLAGARVQALDIGPLRRNLLYESFGRDGYLYLRGSQIAFTATSGAGGRFTLRGLPPGVCCAVRVTAPGHVGRLLYAATTDRPQPNLVELSYGAGRKRTQIEPVQVGDLQVGLAPGQTLRGKVVLADTGQPAAGVRVSASDRDGPYGEVVTDVAGRFTLTGLPPGQSHLFLWPQGPTDYLSLTATAEVPAPPTEREPTFSLPRGAVVTGQVVDAETGRGVADVSINHRQPEGSVPSAWASGGLSDADGRFRLVVPPGKGVLFAYTGTGVYPGLPEQGVEAGLEKPVHGIKLTLSRGLVVKGRVFDPEGRPLADAEVEYAPVEHPQSPRYAATTDAEGQFTVSGLTADGKYELYIIHARRKLGGQILVPPPADSKKAVPQEITLRPLGAVAGRVVDEQQRPVAGATVAFRTCVTLPPGNAHTLKAVDPEALTTDADGRYRFEHLLPAASYTYRVEASAKGYAGLNSEEFPARPGETKALPDLVLPRAAESVAGIVVDPAGRPLADVEVRASPRWPGRGPVVTSPESVVTAADGRFHITGLPRGPVELTAELYTAGEEAAPTRLYPPQPVPAQAGQQDLRIVLAVRPRQYAAEAVVRKPAPAFAVRRWLGRADAPAGRGFEGRDYAGKVVLLVFLDEAKPSQRLLPRLNQLHQQWAGKGLVIVRVSEAAADAQLAKTSPISTALVAPAEVPGSNGEAFQKYGVRATPALFLLDRTGTLRYADVEVADLETRIAELLAR